jgi:hypothetical protein
MKTLLALCFLCLAALADEGAPPQPSGDKSRFTMVSGQVDYGSGPVPIFMRLDTFTGQTWALQAVPLPGGGVIHTWVPSHELGSELYGIAVKAMQEKVEKR